MSLLVLGTHQHSRFKDPYIAKPGPAHPKLSVSISYWHPNSSFGPDKHHILHPRAPKITCW